MKAVREAAAVPPGTALRFWTKLGFISFGGPAGQIALMHEELVERRRWMSERRFTHALNFTMLLPGPEAQQLATYLGWLMHGTAGGIAAGVLFVLPSLAVLIGLSWVYLALGHVPLVAGIFYGIKPVVTAIVLLAAWRIGKRTLDSAMLWAIALVAFIGLLVFNVPFPAVMLGAALVGFLASRTSRDGSGTRTPATSPAATEAPPGDRSFVFDDDTPLPAHATSTRARLAAVAVVTVLLGAVAYAALVATAGSGSLLTDMAAFFAKAAFLTFGGAYAVLPYVFQAGVETYGWLGPAQMLDGLALGETTPGPLIMVVAFIGFVGAAQGSGGSEALLAAGAMGAVVATFFTFLPSFAFILIGAPLVEATRHDLRLTGPLKAVTAAVVGVIANLACLFGWHVFVPFGTVDGLAIAVAIVALAAMVWRGWSPLVTILCGALLGLLQSLSGVMWM